MTPSIAPSSDNGVGETAKGVGLMILGGWLATAIPFVGIPILLVGMKATKDGLTDG